MLNLQMIFLISGCSASRVPGADPTSDTADLRSAADIGLPDGYRIEAVARGLVSPTAVTFDNAGGVYVIEAGPGGGAEARLSRVRPDGSTVAIATGSDWVGAAWSGGGFFVSEGGLLGEGRVLRISADGESTVLATDFPGRGGPPTNGPVIGPDGWLYFGQQARGEGAPGAVVRLSPVDSRVDVIASGFREPFGVAFAPDGCLFVSDRGPAGDDLWEVEPGVSYEAPGEAPALVFAAGGGTTGIDFSRAESFGHVGRAFVAGGGDLSQVDVDSGVVEAFTSSRGRGRKGGLERPVAVRFDPTGHSLYVLDQGRAPIEPDEAGAGAGHGVLWRIWRD